MNKLKQSDFQLLFESGPGLYLILLPDFTIAGASDAYLSATMTKREEICGHDLFEVFPDNPDDHEATGVSNLRTSLNSVLKNKKPHKMAVQKYDIRKPDGVFEERYWSPLNKPVFDSKNKISFIIHQVEDVTELELMKKKVNVAAEIFKNEKRFRTLIENNYDAITLNNAQGTPLYQSPSVERMLGWTLEERKEFRGFSFIHPDDAEELKNIFQQARLNPGKPYHSIHRLKHKNGNYIWTEGIITNLLLDPDINAFVSNFHDISARKEAEDKLSKSETRFRKLIDNNFDAITLSDEKATPFYQSSSTEKLLGWTLEERIKIGGFSTIHPDDIAEVSKKWKDALENPGKVVPTLHRTKHKKGHFIWTEGNITNLLHDPAINAIVYNFQDITASKAGEEKLKKSEKLFRSIVRNIPKSVVIVVDKDHRYLMVEGEIMERLGYKRQDYEGKHPLEVGSKERYEASKHLYERVFNGEQFSMEQSSEHGDYIIHFVPMKEEDGSVETALIIALDISEVKKASNEILKLNASLEKRAAELSESNEELERFAYIASHDLQEPLRMVTSFLQLLQKRYAGKLDESANQYIHFAVDGSDRMKNLIQDLLEYSRVGVNKDDFVKVDLNSVLADVMNLFSENIRTSNAKITIAELPVIEGRKVQLQQLFQNLLSNAIKYRSEEAPVIEIGCIDKKNQWEFFVRDNGIGIDPKFNEKIFIIFQRLHNKNEYAGTGIGLSICRKIVERHGGRLWVESKLGQGSTFRFTLAK